ncbi:tyrosine-type recombinase/integrase [Demequina phytophila]|uniref:tyrosine-type recombinase/integrase n=1 Tax=Demequina phytophila TaxID=1638981 RepID=UPI000783C2AB|nr:tyrosine-type recombinase/integrase [Demequina phytophila]
MSTHPGITDLGDGKYRVRVYDPRTRGYLQRRVTGVREARRVQAVLKAEVQRSDVLVRSGRAPTVKDFAEAWRVELRHAPLTAVNVEATLRTHIYPALGRTRVTDVTHNHALRFVRVLSESDLAVATQAKVDTQARHLFDAVVAEGWREASPFARVPRIRAPRSALRRQGEYIPSPTEAMSLIGAARAVGRDDVALFMLLALGAGLRGSEVVGLDADALAGGTVVVRQQLLRADGRFYLSAPKTSAGERTVPLAPIVLDAVMAYRATHAPLAAALPVMDRGREREVRETSLVLSGPHGGPWQETVAARQVAAFAGRADFPGRVTAHTFRKTFTTILGDAGVPLRVIDAVTGHESSGLTLGTYTAVTPAGLERARDAVQDALA